ncbi:MAG: class I SAM-dependent methyltransferase [Methanobacterium sp.]
MNNNNKERLDNISKHYDNLDFAKQNFREKRAKTYFEWVWDKEFVITMSYLTDFISQGKNLKALDIGCSSGRYTKALIAKGVDGVGIDTSEIALSCARKWVPDGNFICASITKLPFDRESFDIVICMELFCHLPDEILEESLEEISKVIKPGGFFIFDIKNKLNPVLNLAYKRADSTEFTLKARSVRELTEMVEAKGFKVVAKKGIFFPIPILAPYVICCSIKEESVK